MPMGSSYWKTESWRMMLVLFVALLGGKLSGYWLVSLNGALIGYIGWLLYKIYHLYKWLKNGANSNSLPDNNGILEAITHQIQVLEKKSKKRKKRMSKLLRRFQAIITGLPDATVVINANNEIDWANKMATDYLYIDIKKDHGQRLDNLMRMPNVHKMLANNSREEIEISLPQHPGRQLTLQFIPVQKDLKLLFARDISERVHIQQMRKNFIANASHELRTPLTVISGYLEMMSADDNLPEYLQTAVNSASAQSARMQHIIEEMLTLSQLEQSELDDQSCTVIDMASIIQGICDNEAALLTDNTHFLETKLESSLLLKGAETEIISVCSNLIHNAIRHTQDGTQVKVTWKKTFSGEACLTVKDNGQGIPAEHLSHLTERFYRVDKGRKQDKGGTGLGLAIVQHIMQRHGGRLTIQSTVSKGSTFTACFPIEKVLSSPVEGDKH
jgi:two-component system, OmpR family, phosphate regulon sensor histidine kinase PhoR